MIHLFSRLCSLPSILHPPLSPGISKNKVPEKKRRRRKKGLGEIGVEMKKYIYIDIYFSLGWGGQGL